MPRLAVLLAPAVLALMTACAGERLSLEVYAEQCGSLTNEMKDGFDSIVFRSTAVAEAMEEFEDAIANIKNLNPPEDLERLHELYESAAESVLKGLRDSRLLELAEKLEEVENLDPDEQSDQLEKFLVEWADQMEDMEEDFENIQVDLDRLRDQIADEENGLSPDDYDNLVEEGCESVL